MSFGVAIAVGFLGGGALSAEGAPIGPEVTGEIALGSEVSFANIGSASTINGAARSNFLTLVAITGDGKFWVRNSQAYAKPWRPAAGCGTLTNCYSPYQVSGQRYTEWQNWRVELGDRRFDPTVQPQVLYSKGVLHVFLSQKSPDRRIIHVVMRDDATYLSTWLVTGILGDNVTSLSAIQFGGLHEVAAGAGFVSVYFSDRSYRIFQTNSLGSSSGGWTERAASTMALSDLRPRFVAFGAGNSQAALLISRGSNWSARYFSWLPGPALPAETGSGQFSGFTAGAAPDLAWIPGDYIDAVYLDAAGRLTETVGIKTNTALALPRGVLVPGPAVLDVKVFSRAGEVQVLAVYTDKSVRLFRFSPEETRERLQLIYQGTLPAAHVPGSLSVMTLGAEAYVALATTDGYLRWINVQRAATGYISGVNNIFHFATPSMSRFSPSELFSFSSFADALNAMPVNFRRMYINQPSERCHPDSFPTKIACGKAFIEWNDYGNTPTPPDVWQTLTSALTTFDDTNPWNDWSPYKFTASEGSIVAKSGVTGSFIFLHEMMHNLDLDGINGTLVPGLDEQAGDYATIFGNRSGADLSDGARGIGFISNYAESNAMEDWAETGAFFRIRGAYFRYLAALDQSRGDDRLQQKYDFAKVVWGNREFSDFGTRFYGDKMVPLTLVRQLGVPDFALAGDAASATRLLDTMGFRLAGEYGTEGWLLKEAVEGQTLPLKLFRNRANGEIGVGTGRSHFTSSRYDDLGITIGHAFINNRPNTRPLRLFYSNRLIESRTAASQGEVGALQANPDYREIAIDGYVLAEPFL